MFIQKFRSSNTFTIFVVCIAIFTDTLLLNIVVPILPYVLSDRVELSPEDAQKWNSILLASYGAAMIFGSLIFGWIGDRLRSRQTPFIMGLAFLAGTTLCFALASSTSVLFIARLLQGLSSAVVFTFGRSLLLDRVGHERIGRAMGYTGTAMSLGLLLGPVIGGVLYQYVGYFGVFLVPIGLIVAEMLLRALVVEKRTCQSVKDTPQNLVSAGAAQEAPEDSKQPNNKDPTMENESQRAPFHQAGDDVPTPGEPESQPLLQSSDQCASAYPILLMSSRFMTTITSLLILSGLANGFDAILPAYSHDALDLSPSQVAFLFLAMGGPMALAPLAGWATDRYGPKWLAMSGLIILTIGLIFLWTVTAESSNPYLKLMGLLFLIGVGFSLAISPLQTEVSTTVQAIENQTPGIFGKFGAYSQAYGLMNAAFAAGSMVGPLYTGFVRVWLGWPGATLSMAFLSGFALSLTAAFTGGQWVCQVRSKQ